MRTKDEVEPQGMLEIGEGVTKSRKISSSPLSLLSVAKNPAFFGVRFKIPSLISPTVN